MFSERPQIGFGGFEFGGESYIASPKSGEIAPEFAAVVDADGKATNVNEKGSVVTFTAAGVEVEAVGGAVPTEITPNLEADGISDIAADKAALNDKVFNLAGQQVSNGFRGLVVKNGKKFVNK